MESCSTWTALEVWSLTTLAHTMAGGALPSLPWLGGLALLVWAATALVLRASVSLWLVLPALAASQVGLHLALTSMPPAPTSHVHDMAGPASTPGMLQDGLAWPMLAAHLASALLTAAVWSLRRRVVDSVTRLSGSFGWRLPIPPDLRPRQTREQAPQRVWRLGRPRRGPPPGPAAA